MNQVPPYSFTPGALKAERNEKEEGTMDQDADALSTESMHHSRHLQIVFGEGTNATMWLALALVSTP